MKKETKENLQQKIMPKLLSNLSHNDKKSMLNLLKMQANYIYYTKGYGSKKSDSQKYAHAAYQFMCNSYISMGEKGQARIKQLHLKSLTPSQKNNWGLIASSYAKKHPELLKSQSVYHNSTSNEQKVNIAWKEIGKLNQKGNKERAYYRKHGYPFNVVLSSVSSKDKLPLAHMIEDQSRINYANYKGFKASHYQKDLTKNKEYITPQGLNKFNSLLKVESPKNFNTLGFASASYIKKYNQVHPAFNINYALSKISQEDRLPVAQYLNDMSKGYYFGLHNNEKLGNSLIDNGKDAKGKLSENSQKVAQKIISNGMKNHTLGTIGFQAHKYVNNQFKDFKHQHKNSYSQSFSYGHHNQYSKSVNTEDNKNLKHVNLASKIFGNNAKKKPKMSHHFNNFKKPSLHPKKEIKKHPKLSSKEEQSREKMFTDLNQQGQNQQQ